MKAGWGVGWDSHTAEVGRSRRRRKPQPGLKLAAAPLALMMTDIHGGEVVCIELLAAKTSWGGRQRCGAKRRVWLAEWICKNYVDKLVLILSSVFRRHQLIHKRFMVRRAREAVRLVCTMQHSVEPPQPAVAGVWRNVPGGSRSGWLRLHFFLLPWVARAVGFCGGANRKRPAFWRLL